MTVNPPNQATVEDSVIHGGAACQELDRHDLCFRSLFLTGQKRRENGRRSLGTFKEASVLPTKVGGRGRAEQEPEV